MVFDSVIADGEPSWEAKARGNIMTRPLGREDLVRLYYAVRNRVHFEKHALVLNRLVWWVNMAAALSGAALFALVSLKGKNLGFFSRGLHDGMRDRLGRFQ
ncbi:MAG: hypothetical protein JXB23_01275 [Candidatus Aminicenantes bacterium]|nr:hypothetical protein [Candidatus Aminicenantes bacterium]